MASPPSASTPAPSASESAEAPSPAAKLCRRGCALRNPINFDCTIAPLFHDELSIARQITLDIPNHTVARLTKEAPFLGRKKF